MVLAIVLIIEKRKWKENAEDFWKILQNKVQYQSHSWVVSRMLQSLMAIIKMIKIKIKMIIMITMTIVNEQINLSTHRRSMF